jgi:hypothetical protein
MRSRNGNPLADDQTDDHLPPPGAGGFDVGATSAAHEDPAEAGDWDAETAEVLTVLVEAAAPVPHQHLLTSLARRGHSREAARAAIGRSQASGWIQHDLVSGYVLSPGASEEAPLFDVK